MSGSPELRLKRFIHLGVEVPTYLPGWAKYRAKMHLRDLSSLNDFLEQGKHKEYNSIILKAFTDGYSVVPEALVFALAAAARQDKSEAMREAAYSTARTVCKSPDSFFLFIKYCNQFSAGKGFGTGLKRMVAEWYHSKEPMELLRIVTESFKCHGWSHRDVIRLCHVAVKEKDDAMQAVFCYINRGLPAMKKQFADKPEIRPYIAYVQAFHDFKTESNKEVAMKLAEVHKFGLVHTSEEMKSRSKWIWPFFIPKVALRDVLNNLKRLGHMRLINENQPLAAVVHSSLINQENIATSGVSPAEVFILLNKYENIAKLKAEVTKKHPRHTHPENQLPLAANPKIVEGLNFLLGHSYKLLVPTGLRYMVVVDVRAEMKEGECFQMNALTPLKAASIITLGLIKTERSVFVCTYGNKGNVHILRIGKNLSVQEVYDKFTAVTSCPVDISQPINWAKNKAKDFDVFLMITNNQVQQLNMMSPAKALQQYRKKVNQPNAKLIVCALNCVCPFKIADKEDPGMLEIAGFDSNVPRVIEAFSRGAF